MRLLPLFIAPGDTFVIEADRLPGCIPWALVLSACCFGCVRLSPGDSPSTFDICIFIFLVEITFLAFVCLCMTDHHFDTLARLIGCIIAAPFLIIISPYRWCRDGPGLDLPPYSYEHPRPSFPDLPTTTTPLLRPRSRSDRPTSPQLQPSSRPCELCQTCRSIVSHSPLLTGSGGVSTDGVGIETYAHLTVQCLRESAQNCHLCQLLWCSLNQRWRDRISNSLPQFPSTSASASASVSASASASASASVSASASASASASTSTPLPIPDCVNSTSPDPKDCEPFTVIDLSAPRCSELPKSTDEETCVLQKPDEVNTTEHKPTDRQNGYGTCSPAEKHFHLKLWGKSSAQSSTWRMMQLVQDEITESRPLKIERLSTTYQHKCSLSNALDSSVVMKWAEDKIKTCSEGHKYCQNKFVPKASTTYRPKRLLDVQDAHYSKIRLVQTSKLGIRDPGSLDYVALSHRWGGAIEMMLKKENYEKLQSIEVKDLPRTFEDAVSIARQINVRYLWIDSLCIQQDSDEEKQIEIANMGLIYANAKCIISATASEDSTCGCFVSTNPFVEDCVLSPPSGFSLVVRSGIKAPFFKPWEETLVSLVDQKVERTSLSTRGWTFQERFLASRVLHFCNGIVLFECNTLIASRHHNDLRYRSQTTVRADGTSHSSKIVEMASRDVSSTIREVTGTYKQAAKNQYTRRPATRPSRPARTFERSRTKVNPKYEAQRKVQRESIKEIFETSARLGMRGAFEFLYQFSGTTEDSKIEFHNRWYEMVEKYSIRELTEVSDKLKALAGVAYFIQKNPRLDYVAGLWSDKGKQNELLQTNLLWACTGPPEGRTRLSAPSWSWGSINGRISQRLPPSTSSQSSSYLTDNNTLTGKPETSSGCQSVDWYINEVKFDAIDTIDANRSGSSLNHNTTLSLHCYPFACHRSKVHYIPDIEHSTPRVLFCLPIISFTLDRENVKDRERQVHGIVLREKPYEKHLYERTGYFWALRFDIAKEMLTEEKYVRLA